MQIHHSKSDCYVNFDDTGKEVFIDIDVKLIEFKVTDIAQKYINLPTIKKSKVKRVEVVNQNKSKTLWKILKHEDYESTKINDQIKDRDIVYFEHTKQKGLLCSSLKTYKTFLK